ncbi:MAG: hypothetical protein JSW67_02915 [Candidatus Latescibacterota bacterium]|nr:MAG: hypothetical protein JSW67_02915 [Candidatus Latescibacterota bacterium]
MARLIETLLLTALPASGKSEVRRYLARLDGDAVRRDFGMGPTVQLDDYPYVHMMRRISQELTARGEGPVFFPSDDRTFCDPHDWGTLIELVNEDFHDLHERPDLRPDSAARWLLERLDAARARAGAAPFLSVLSKRTRRELDDVLETEARKLLKEKRAGIPQSLEDRTVVIEFARGGPEGSSMPLPAPYGYAWSFAQLSDAILERACVLYVWVTPEESRRKNDERAKPGRDGDASILHHGVPEAVMRGEYGTDDMGYLIDASDRPGTVRVETQQRVFHLPVGRFDNRNDLTTFIRDDPSIWSAADVEALHSGLRHAFVQITR